MRRIVLILVTIMVAVAGCLNSPCIADPLELYIDVDGNDTWTGRKATVDLQTKSGPYATLERARDELRRLKAGGSLNDGAVVLLRGGRYSLKQTFQLTADDAGTPEAPISYRAYQSEKVVLTGGRFVKGFATVTDPAILKRIEPSARPHVLAASLKKSGIADFGDAVAASNRLELFFDDQPMTLARWPNKGFIRIAEVTGGKPYDIRGTVGDRVGKFTYKEDRPARWTDENDLRLHGYWFWDWKDQYQKVRSIDHSKREITLVPPYHGYGYRRGQRFYALNALAELDRPGEWYLDRQSGILYFWPPGDVKTSTPAVSVLRNLIVLEGASHVTIQGLTLELCRSTAVLIRGGSHNAVVGCTIRNTGSWAVAVSGNHSGVFGCDIVRTAEGGISLSGGDRNKLASAELCAENNHIHDFGRLYRTYRPAVSIRGVGNRVVHNLIHNGPHNAIQLGGNDHRIEYNEVYDVCHETGDVGAFYMGRDWTERGTVIRHNFFHHISGPGLHGAMAVYLDDAASGIEVFGNVFYRAGRAGFIGGGRDNRIVNNIFVECKPSVHIDARGLNWMHATVEKGGTMMKRLDQMPYQRPPWSTRYPKLVNLLNENPAAPNGNVVARNISQGGRWLNLAKEAKPLTRFDNNLIDVDPHFVDAEAMNFQLKDDSPAYKLGFKRIPFERIGLFEDTRRASWPVKKSRRTHQSKAASK